MSNSKLRTRHNLAISMLVMILATSFTAAPQFLIAQDAEDTKPVTLHDKFAEIGKRVPEFGGMFVNQSEGKLYVYLLHLDPITMQQVDNLIPDVLGSDAVQVAGLQREPLQARYSFTQLKEWSDRMIPVVGALPEVTILGIDDRSNSLDIGLETMAAESTVYVQLLNLGIPLDAVNITQVARAHFTQNLWGMERPLVGGLKAEGWTFGIKPLGSCTLGFNAKLVLEKGKAAVDGFVTCSHCQFLPGTDDDGTMWFQPTKDAAQGNLVGPKKTDPCYRSDDRRDPCGFEQMCPAGKICRRSDSAFVQRTMGAATLGSIARPEPGAPPPFVYGKNTFKIVGEVNPMCCVSVEKIGQTTGRTIGEVKLTGQYVPVERDRAILDATLVNMIVQKGDSGAPVVTLVDTKCAANPCTANLAGIVFAVDGPIAYFSPVADIRLATELGNTLVTH